MERINFSIKDKDIEVRKAAISTGESPIVVQEEVKKEIVVEVPINGQDNSSNNNINGQPDNEDIIKVKENGDHEEDKKEEPEDANGGDEVKPELRRNYSRKKHWPLKFTVQIPG